MLNSTPLNNLPLNSPDSGSGAVPTFSVSASASAASGLQGAVIQIVYSSLRPFTAGTTPAVALGSNGTISWTPQTLSGGVYSRTFTFTSNSGTVPGTYQFTQSFVSTDATVQNTALSLQVSITAVEDADPDVFSVANLTGQNQNTWVQHPYITVSGINVAVSGSGSNCQFQVERLISGTWTLVTSGWVSSGTVFQGIQNGDRVTPRVLTSASAGTPVNCSLQIGSRSVSWSVTTATTTAPTYTSPPAITLIPYPGGALNRSYVVGDVFVDPGATAVDATDGPYNSGNPFYGTHNIPLSGGAVTVPGTYSVQYTVTNGGAYLTPPLSTSVTTSVVTRQITVTANQLPVVNAANFTLQQGQSTNFSVVATDPDGDALTYSRGAGAPAWLTQSGSANSFTVSAASLAAGSYTFPITVTDSRGGATTRTFNLTVEAVASSVRTLSVPSGTIRHNNSTNFTGVMAHWFLTSTQDMEAAIKSGAGVVVVAQGVDLSVTSGGFSLQVDTASVQVGGNYTLVAYSGETVNEKSLYFRQAVVAA